MALTFEDYLAAHEDFFLEKPRTEKYWERIALYVKAEHELKDKLTALEFLVVEEKFNILKAAFLNTTGSKVFFRDMPRLAEAQKEINEYRSAYRSMVQHVTDEFAQRISSYPLNNIAVDVLVSKGLQIIITPLHGSLGTSDREYRLSLHHKLRKAQRNLTIVHELCHMFYGGNDFQPVLTKIGAESPLEAAIDREAAAVLKREPQLAAYVLEKGKKRITFSGYAEDRSQ